MSPPPDAILVFEVGGTNLRAGLFREDPSPHVTLSKRAEEPGLGPHQAVDTCFRLAGELLEEPPSLVGVAWPGPIDARGVALASPTMGYMQPFDVEGAFRRGFADARVRVVNDLTAAGLRLTEEGSEDFCIITVGSGIGHKVFIGGRALVGAGGMGGELGHLLVDRSAEAPRCACGRVGHLGAIASGRGVVAAMRRAALADPAAFRSSRLGGIVRGDEVSGPDVARAFASNDQWTTEIVTRASSYLGIAIASVHLGVGIERFVLVGGFALAMGEPYRELVARSAGAASWDLGQDWAGMVELGSSDDDHGMVGAGLVAIGDAPGSAGVR